MMDFLVNYGLFLAKAVTIVFFIVVVVALIASIAQKKPSEDDQIEIKNLSKKFADIKALMQSSVLSKKELKAFKKEHKQASKKAADKGHDKRVFVLNFVGNIKASGVKH